VGDRDWGAGILGLIASQIVEKYNVNAFVWGGGEIEQNEGEIFKGSCRSNGEAHVVKLMTDAANLFTHFGGHEMSGGFAIEIKNIFELEKTLNEIYKKDKKAHIEKKEEDKNENILKIFLEEVDYKMLDTLSLLAPFGTGNATPTFQIENLKDVKSERFGKNKEHLKLILRAGEEKITTREAIKFFCDEKLEGEILNKNWSEFKFQIEAGFRSNIPRLKLVI
jgi:single-stranded-DNA-specific exonuclease